MSVGRLESQLEILHNEKQFLCEKLQSNTNQLNEFRQKCLESSRELIQLKELPQRLEDLHTQLKEQSIKRKELEVQVGRQENGAPRPQLSVHIGTKYLESFLHVIAIQ